MKKTNLNYKLANTALIMLIIFLMYQARGLWNGIFDKLFSIFIPSLIAFTFAYALYPYTQYLRKNGIPKAISIFIILVVFFGIFILVGAFAIPLLVSQLGNLFNGIITFIKEISIQYDIDFGPLQSTLTETFNEILKNSGKYISDGAISFVSTGLGFIGTFVIVVSMGIYLLVDMDKIRAFIKSSCKKKSKKTYNYVKALDNAMKGYLSGFTKIVIISVFEYTIAFLIIGHPDAVLLGFLAALGNLIPYFGGIITNLIALITAFVVGPSLFIKALIVFAVLSLLDSYVINPFVYGKSTELEPIVVIFAIFAGGILFGVLGVIISIPIALILVTTYKFYKDDISDKLTELKEDTI